VPVLRGPDHAVTSDRLGVVATRRVRGQCPAQVRSRIGRDRGRRREQRRVLVHEADHLIAGRSEPDRRGARRGQGDARVVAVVQRGFVDTPWLGRDRSVHDAEEPSTVLARVLAANRSTGRQRTDPRGGGAAVRAVGAGGANWVKQPGLDAGRRTDGLTTTEHEELRRLRRENCLLREERAILSKAAAWFARETNTIPSKDSSS
jgi:hypothetical protein